MKANLDSETKSDWASARVVIPILHLFQAVDQELKEIH